jgi:DNA-binding beta-propeller fold protein YncE
MSWKSTRSKMRPLVGAAVTFAAALAQMLSAPAGADPVGPDAAASRPVIFAVDPVLGQAYITLPGPVDQTDGSISVFSLATRQEIGSIPYYTAPPSAISVNPLTGLVYVANAVQDTITVVHGPTLRVVTTARVTGGPQVLLLEPNSGKLYVGLGRERAIRVLDLATLTATGAVDLGLEPLALGLDRVRNRLMAVALNAEAESASLLVIDNERLSSIDQILLPDRPDGLAILDGLGRAYVPLASEGDILVVDVDPLMVINRLSGWETRVRDIAVNERRSRVYLAAGDADLIIALEPLSGSVMGSVQTGTPTDALAVDQATARIYIASSDGATVNAIVDPVGPRPASSELSITFQVTGGLAGLNDVLTISPPGQAHLQRRVGTPIDVELGPNRFQELAALFPESDFFNMLPRHIALRPIPDALTFSVTARDAHREHTVVMSTSGSPPVALVDIVRRLERVRQEMISPPAPVAIGLVEPFLKRT